jgi:hypothetical protein
VNQVLGFGALDVSILMGLSVVVGFFRMDLGIRLCVPQILFVYLVSEPPIVDAHYLKIGDRRSSWAASAGEVYHDIHSGITGI